MRHTCTEKAKYSASFLIRPFPAEIDILYIFRGVARLKRGVSKRKLVPRIFGATPTTGDTPLLFGSHLLLHVQERTTKTID